MAISTAPALEPAIILRSGLGFSFLGGGCVLTPMFGTGTAVVDAIVAEVVYERGRVAVVANNTESQEYDMRMPYNSFSVCRCFSGGMACSRCSESIGFAAGAKVDRRTA